MLKSPESFVHEHEGVIVARPTFGITLFSNEPISEFSDGVLRAFDRYRALVGDDALRFYSTATMQKHRKVTKRALSMLSDWFGPEAPPSESYGIEFIDADVFNEAPKSRFAIFGVEGVWNAEEVEVKTASLLRLVLPVSWGERTDEALALAEELCGMLPFQSGQAGYALEHSRYFVEAAHEFAIPKSMRHPGFDVHNQTGLEGNAVGWTRVRSVGWLTMLCDAFVAELGGPPTLEDSSVSTVPGGIILRAGAAPAVGDVNRKDDLPAYREVYAYIEPLAREMPEKAPWFSFFRTAGSDDRTEAWYRRFEP